MAIRTDLALEAAMEGGSPPTGVTVQETAREHCTVTVVTVETEEGAQQLGKPVGRYITIEGTPFYRPDLAPEDLARTVAEELRALLPDEGLVMVVGLGNVHMTPDALGPQVADWTLATRHLPEEDRRGIEVLERLRPVISVAPGVMGQTGMESAELVEALVRRFQPAAVVAVDAMASRSLDRLGRTLQLTDGGVAPGSGVQNNRVALDQKTLGVPVVGIGVPTVVDGSTLAYDLLHVRPEGVEEASLRALFDPRGAAMMVTPQEVDLLVQRAAKVVSLAVNLALQPHLTPEEITALNE